LYGTTRKIDAKAIEIVKAITRITLTTFYLGGLGYHVDTEGILLVTNVSKCDCTKLQSAFKNTKEG
jgi:hypothetical protein